MKERLQRGYMMLLLQSADEVVGGTELATVLAAAAKRVLDWEMLDLEIADCDMVLREILVGAVA
jgi:hypothetical protein